MKFFIDTASLYKTKIAVSFGVIDRVTTNPSLASKESDIDFYTRVNKL